MRAAGWPGAGGSARLMFFLSCSSEKYPEEDAYSKFISDHGGSTNAYTASEDTNYQVWQARRRRSGVRVQGLLV